MRGKNSSFLLLRDCFWSHTFALASLPSFLSRSWQVTVRTWQFYPVSTLEIGSIVRVRHFILSAPHGLWFLLCWSGCCSFHSIRHTHRSVQTFISYPLIEHFKCTALKAQLVFAVDGILYTCSLACSPLCWVCFTYLNKPWWLQKRWIN